MFCQSARKKIRQFFNTVSQEVFAHAAVALQFTTVLKQYLTSPVADIVTALIPGTWDNVVRAQILGALEVAIPALMAANECGAPNMPLEQRLQCIAKHLRNLPKKQRDATLIKLASIITAHLDLGTHKQHVYDAIVQMQYSLQKTK